MGSRWIHYAVPRGAFVVPAVRLYPQAAQEETAHVARYVLNTATTHRPVLPPLTDALLVGKQFRRAVMALYGLANNGATSPNLSGKNQYGEPLKGHGHAFFLPEDEDEDGFIDHITVWCPNGFTVGEVQALHSLIRLRQRRGRPDLLVTLSRIARKDLCRDLPLFQESQRFISRTPYVPPRHAYRRSKSGKIRISEPDLPANQLQREVNQRFSDEASRAGWNVTVRPLQLPYKVQGGGEIQQCAHIKLKNRRLPCIAFLQHRRVKEEQRGLPDDGQVGGAWLIDFLQPVHGPLALGYAAHFGLGFFAPAPEGAGATFIPTPGNPSPHPRRSAP